MRYNTMIQLVLSISCLLVMTAVLFARLQSREMPQSTEENLISPALQSTEPISSPGSVQGSGALE